MTVGIWVGEKTALEDGVGRWFDARRHVCWVESDLLNLGEVVLGVLVQLENTDLAERELLVWPDVGQVEDVDALLLPKLFSLLGCHRLELDSPRWVVALLDSVEKVLLRVIWRFICGLFLGDEFGALARLHVHLGVHPVTSFIDELHGVSGISVHEAVAIWDTSITHENHDLVNGLGVLGQIVPEHSAIIGTAEMCGWVALLCVDEVRELGGIAQEENWGVVGHHIPVAFFSSELDGETSRVTSTVVRARFATDRREADGDWAFLASFAEDIGKT